MHSPKYEQFFMMDALFRNTVGITISDRGSSITVLGMRLISPYMVST